MDILLVSSLHSVSKQMQLSFMDFSWGPGSGSCDPGSWEISKPNTGSFLILMFDFWLSGCIILLPLSYEKKAWLGRCAYFWYDSDIDANSN